ncbi:MAG: tail fiber domain-containing protein [Chitinophagaceae bacterium]|nr:tail fiber domain-containing protein [Chitinophagaceae bacterium]
MKKVFCAVLLLSPVMITYAQNIGIGTATPNNSAALDITHTSKGLLLPRMSTSAINAITNPAKGLMVYDSVANQLMVNIGTAGSKNWQTIASNSNWNLSGNSGTNIVTQFVGTNDNRPLRFRVNGIRAGELNPALGNVLWGLRAGEYNTTGYSNVAIGTDALKLNSVRSNLVAIGDSALLNNGTGALAGEAFFNTAIGSKSLYSNTRGSYNTAVGTHALYSNTTGNRNVAMGGFALSGNYTGSSNTATGYESLLFNATGNYNTANGHQSLFNNSGGVSNTAMGAAALYANINASNNTGLGYRSLAANIEGNYNTATGSLSLMSNIIGAENTATGTGSLLSNTTGSNNTAIGNASLYTNNIGNNNTAAGGRALYYNTTGSGNTAVGSSSMLSNITGQYNTAVGEGTLFYTTSSQFNTAVGYNAGNYYNMGYNNTFIGAYATGNQSGLYNCVVIGESAVATASNQVRLGNIYTSSIGGYTNWSNISDGRFKKNIQENVKGLDFIMKLRPVTYQLDLSSLRQKRAINDTLKKADDEKSLREKENMIQSGFIAQEVEQAAKDLGYDFSGVDKPKNSNDVYALRYSEFVVPLVKAIQEQQVMIESLKKEIRDLKAEVHTTKGTKSADH